MVTGSRLSQWTCIREAITYILAYHTLSATLKHTCASSLAQTSCPFVRTRHCACHTYTYTANTTQANALHCSWNTYSTYMNIHTYGLVHIYILYIYTSTALYTVHTASSPSPSLQITITACAHTFHMHSFNEYSTTKHCPPSSNAFICAHGNTLAQLMW